METLVVIVFLVTIFMFVYTSILPLMGRYEDMSSRIENIEIVYKLYNIRKMMLNETDIEHITEDSIMNIECNDLVDKNYCLNLMDKLDLDNYKLIYVDGIRENSSALSNIDPEIGDYIRNYLDDHNASLILLDKTNHTIAHLKYVEKYEALKKPTKEGFCKTGLIYNGEEQILVDSALEGFTWNNEKGINAGTYEVEAILSKGYRWEDKTKEEVIIECEIGKNNPVLTFDKERVETYIGGNENIIEKSNVTGSFVNTSLDASKFTIASGASYNNVSNNTGKAVTISGISRGTGNINVDFVPDDIINYNNVSMTLPAEVFALTSINNTCVEGLIYNGSSQTLVIAAREGFTWTSGTTRTNVGSQSVVATLQPGYRWDDLSTGTKSANCSIGAISLSVKATDQSKTYDGTALSANNNCDVTGTLPNGHTLTCINTGSQTNAGSSAKTISSVIIKNESGVDVSASFNVYKETGTLTVSKATPTVTLAASKPNFTEKASVAGTFTNTSSSTTVATVTSSVAVTANTAKTATVTPKYHGSTAVTVKFTPTDTANYNTVTKTVNISVTASSCSWQDDKDSSGKIRCIIRSSKITGQMASYQCSSTITPAEGDRFFTTVSDGNCNVDGGCKILWGSSNIRVRVDSANVILRGCTRSTISSNTTDGSAYTYRLTVYQCSSHAVSTISIS